MQKIFIGLVRDVEIAIMGFFSTLESAQREMHEFFLADAKRFGHSGSPSQIRERAVSMEAQIVEFTLDVAFWWRAEIDPLPVEAIVHPALPFEFGFYLCLNKQDWFLADGDSVPGSNELSGPFSSLDEALKERPRLQATLVTSREGPLQAWRFDAGGWHLLDES